ncbi:cyclophilin-like fold protein [uncultured Bacteroides sp.]|uniref:cyclophilin-like fold protein n=1 Tax=uncultured Bacteroides sp. TaxID=162156 RepID=UPI0025E77AFF|nr:cyclophilin-like fold protein [uncultured Bacteroides sp.]
MKHYIITIFAMLALSVGSASCSEDEPLQGTGQQTIPNNGNGSSGNGSDEGNNGGNNHDNPVSNNLKITIGSASFNATLESNETAKEFKKLLPLTVNMSELNGNEKLFYLQNSLPTASFSPRTIQTGDLMLYGSTCVVLFYESFSTSYTYTRLGRITNPLGLASAVGTGNVNVTFEITD